MMNIMNKGTFNESFSNYSEESNKVNCPLVMSNMWFVKELKTVYIINCVLNLIFAVIAVMGNLLVLYAIIKTPTLHKPSTFLMCNLALTDLAVGLLVQPLYVVYKVAEINGLVSVSCYCGVVVNMLANLFSGMSFISVTCISMDRYLALYLHLRYVAVVTTKRVVKVVIVFWIVNIVFVTFYPWKISIALCYGILVTVVCLFLSTFAFFKIHFIVRKHQKQVNDLYMFSNTMQADHMSFRGLNVAKYWRSVLTMRYVYILLVICYFPYMVTLGTRILIGLTKDYKLALNVTTTIIYINSAINPIIYCYRIKEVRSAMMRVINRKKWKREQCREFPTIYKNEQISMDNLEYINKH